MTEELKDRYDVVVIGGGAAGLNGALMLARSRRSVVVLDAGEPRNAPAQAVHGLFAREGTPPAELLERGRAEVRSYGGQVVSATVTGASGSAGAFEVSLADGRTVRARRLLVTTGLVDVLPEIPGLRDRWGHDVLHCPYCHGWEVRDQAIGVIASGPMAVHQALLFRQLTDDVVFLTHGVAPTPGQLEELTARGIDVFDGPVTAVEADGDRLIGVRLADGRLIERDALVVGPRMVARAAFLGDLGLHTAEHPSGMGDHVVVDAGGATAVPGVYAAGNVADPSAQVGGAGAAGAFAAARINADLVAEETATAVQALRVPAPAG
jgi:thioredoxin reductase